MDATRGAQRLSTLLHHAMHLLVAALWLLGTIQAWQAGSKAQLGQSAVFALVYGSGLVLRRIGRRPVVGRLWILTLALFWFVLTAQAMWWSWLGFPLFFLVLFIVPLPFSGIMVGLMAAWSAIAPFVRGEGLRPGAAIGPCIGAGFSVVCWLVFRQLRADAVEQARLVDELRLARDESIRSAAQLARADERERLAATLHDTLAQGFNTIVLHSRQITAEDPGLAAMIAPIEATARANLASARELVRELATTDLDIGHRLSTVVDLAVEQMRSLGQEVDVQLRIDGDNQPSPAHCELVVGAATSLLGNVMRHAQARTVRLTLGLHPELTTLDVADDGRGFDPDEVRSDSLGLDLLQRRIRQSGGTIEIDSSIGEGTTVGLAIPTRGADDE